ncbi:ABC transporter substrate-binding protein [Paenibacillus ginsengarvi]|uniref:Extracellular solute-binding protein n=1 Tax=Paenibacillus ginsengarvi TaxID=400777 RepID=A0A3B0BXA9_9BACL|nr:extracellular solute-binding protein [Paenibacillus ginsengarvi]RKN76066.1 extracellular solute-binding protein [Paenibacillus ginsengarvi]
MNRNYALLLAGALVFGTVTAGCGAKPQETADGKTGQAGGAQTEKPRDPIELVFYSTSGDFDENGFNKTFGDKIKAKFPHVTPKFIALTKDTALDKLMTTGQTIDILFNSIGQTSETLLNYKMEYDISDMVKKSNYDLSRLEPVTLDIQRQIANGGIYGLPVFTTTLALYYNKDLFDKFGVAYPKDGMTWEDTYELARKMSRTDGQLQYKGLGISFSHTSLLNSKSLPYVDVKTNKAAFSTDGFKNVFETLTKFYEIQNNEVNKDTVSYTKQLQSFDKDQTTAMFLALSTLGSVRFKEGLNWDVVSYPVYKDQPNVGPQSYPTYFYINNASKLKDDAFSVISYLTTDEFQQHLATNGIFPILKNRDAMKSYGSDIPFMKNKNTQSFLPKQFAPAAPVSKYQSIAFNNLNNAYNAVLLKEKDVNTALREQEEKTNKDIEAQLAK